MRSPLRVAPLAAVLALASALLACGSARQSLPPGAAGVLDTLAPAQRTPRDDYAGGLQRAGLAATALGVAWESAGRNALATMTAIPLPHREIGVFDGARPAAVAWQLELRNGQGVLAEVSVDSDEPTRLFLDLLRWDGAAWQPAAGSDDGSLRHDVARDGTYALRLQPELLRGGRWALTLRATGGLAFPVPGSEQRPLIGRFGDGRDGGSRRHEGIDIPAPRGTPAVAAADGLVTRVTTNGLGGKVVWLGDDWGRALYYAHLDEQLVEVGQRVRAGEIVGRVGTSGNAAGTAPHLHFGVYTRGPVDPLPLLVRQAMPPIPAAPSELLGSWGRVLVGSTRLRAAPSTASAVRLELPARTGVAVTGASGEWLRVVLVDGTAGWIHGSLVENAEAPLYRVTPREPWLRERPAIGAAAVAGIEPGPVPVLATAPGWLLVAGPAGRAGWVADPSAPPAGGGSTAASAAAQREP
jgi:hypothetical protein